MKRPARRTRTRAFVATAAASAALLAASACGAGGGGSGGDSSVVVGFQKGALGSYIVSIANAEGYYKDLGLTVNIVNGNSTSAGIAALKGGSYQFYEGGPESLIANQTSHANLKMICGTSNSSGFNIIATKKFKSLAALKGQNFAVSSTSSISTVAAQSAFVANGLGQKDITSVVVGSTSSRYAAMKTGKVQATTLSEPLISQARKDGFNVLGYTDKDLGAPQMVTGTIFADNSWLTGHKATAVKLLQGTERAVKDLYDPSKRDKLAQIISSGLGVDLDQAKTALKETYTPAYEKLNQPKDCHVNMAALLNSAKALQATGALPKGGQPLQKLVDSSVDGSYAKQAFQKLG